MELTEASVSTLTAEPAKQDQAVNVDTAKPIELDKKDSKGNIATTPPLEKVSSTFF
jgi:hypothetical protein